MTPEQKKAKELVERFMGGYQNNGFSYQLPNDETDAKQCALICVDEIIGVINGDGHSWDINTYWNGEQFVSNKEFKEHWQQVKTEIQNYKQWE